MIIAAAMVVCCGTVAVAADHLGVFDKLVHKKDMTFSLPDVEEELPIDKFAVQYDYEKIADAANQKRIPSLQKRRDSHCKWIVCIVTA